MTDVIQPPVGAAMATGTPYTSRLIIAHQIVEDASRDLQVPHRTAGEAVAFLAMAVATNLKLMLGDDAGKAAMQRAIDYAYGPEAG